MFLVYWDALVWYEHDRGGYRTTPDTAGIFSTYPAPHLTLGGGILDQVTKCMKYYVEGTRIETPLDYYTMPAKMVEI